MMTWLNLCQAPQPAEKSCRCAIPGISSTGSEQHSHIGPYTALVWVLMVAMSFCDDQQPFKPSFCTLLLHEIFEIYQ